MASCNRILAFLRLALERGFHFMASWPPCHHAMIGPRVLSGLAVNRPRSRIGSTLLESRLGDLSLTGSPSWHNAVYQLLSQLPITPFSPTRLSLSPSNDWNLHILNISASPVHTRHHGFDLLRVITIYMVMQIHTGEFEYISPAGTVLHTAGSWAVGWTNSLLRVCVPLFVLITGFFLFPIEDERKFFRKRFTRVLIPFVIWCAVYAFYSYAQGAITLQTALLNIAKIPVNYGTEVGHLWFVYMLMAIRS